MTKQRGQSVPLRIPQASGRDTPATLRPVRQALGLRACLKIRRGPVFAERAGWRGVTREHTRQRSVTEEQRSQPALCAKTLRATALLAGAGVGSAVTARWGDAPASPPWPRPKSLVAGPLPIFRQALSLGPGCSMSDYRLQIHCGKARSPRRSHRAHR